MVGKRSISCIIVTPGLNNRFVCERTIPSIIRTTEDLTQWDVEIIVVDNSVGQNFEYYCTDNGHDNILDYVDRVVDSEPNHIPKAYNKGVKLSKNDYIAIFHDDCTINDKLWVEKMVNELSETVYIVGVEEHNDAKPYRDIISKRYVKEVPLVMKKSCFNEVGGYDETYYLGFENVMFCNSVYNLGKKIVVLDIEHTHFNGLSTMNILIKKGVTKDLEKTISELTNKSEFRKLQKDLLGTIEVNVGNMLSNRWLRRLMYFIGIFKTIKMTKGFGTNLGYSKCFSYWKTIQIPTEVIVGLMPRTRKDFELLLMDIKYGMDGELYTKLNKHKGPLFVEYFNGR
jgi:glycosyltransferase involved in cell wall biosynthesis